MWVLGWSLAQLEAGVGLGVEPACMLSRSLLSDSATPSTIAGHHICPWDFPGKNTGVGCHFLL